MRSVTWDASVSSRRAPSSTAQRRKQPRCRLCLAGTHFVSDCVSSGRSDQERPKGASAQCYFRSCRHFRVSFTKAEQDPEVDSTGDEAKTLDGLYRGVSWHESCLM